MYLVRMSNQSAGSGQVRDGRSLDDPMKTVGPDWVPFNHLPAGVPEHGGAGFDVVAVPDGDVKRVLASLKKAEKSRADEAKAYREAVQRRIDVMMGRVEPDDKEHKAKRAAKKAAAEAGGDTDSKTAEAETGGE